MDMRKKNACFRCCRSCFIRHQNKNDDSSLSFFKIMFGSKFDEILAMPPMFSKKVKEQVRKKMTLEDSNKRQWDVEVSDLEGSLGFQTGWRNFVLDHDIEMGDLLVFHYVRHGHFLVEIFGKTGCPKNCTVKSMDNDITSETTKRSRPTKLSFDLDEEYEQPTRKRYCNYPSSKRVREPPIRETSPTVVPLADTHVDPMTRREKDKPKLDPVVETQDPCLTTNTPKRAPKADTLGDPCFMTCQDNIFIEVDDGDRLFDLSTFEMPNKKSATDREKETQDRPDLPILDSPQNESDPHRSTTVTGMADKKSVINREVEDNLSDKSAFESEMPENDYLNIRDKGKLHGNLHCQESDDISQNTEITAASADLPKCEVIERCTKEAPSEPCETELLRLEWASLSSSPPKRDLPIDSVKPLKMIGKPETSISSTLSGGKMGPINLETKVYNQEFCGGKSGNAGGGSSLGTNFSDGKLSSGDLGGSIKRIKQESRDVKQDMFSGDAMGSSCCDGFTSDYTFRSGDFVEGFDPVVKIEGNVGTIVKLEPVDCYAPSATAIKVICSVPPDSEYFLELPAPLPVAVKIYRTRGVKHKHQLVFLRDVGGRLWPVIYHHRNNLNVLTSGWTTFLKAYNIQPGDKCIFTLENSEESTIAIEIDRHD